MSRAAAQIALVTHSRTMIRGVGTGGCTLRASTGTTSFWRGQTAGRPPHGSPADAWLPFRNSRREASTIGFPRRVRNSLTSSNSRIPGSNPGSMRARHPRMDDPALDAIRVRSPLARTLADAIDPPRSSRTAQSAVGSIRPRLDEPSCEVELGTHHPTTPNTSRVVSSSNVTATIFDRVTGRGGTFRSGVWVRAVSHSSIDSPPRQVTCSARVRDTSRLRSHPSSREVSRVRAALGP
jgi:hypothetical protein